MSLTNLNNWVDQITQLTGAAEVFWCTGSAAEAQKMNALLVERGTFIPLNSELRPNSFLARTDPRDVARVEDRTFICSEAQADAGPTNNWMDPAEMRELLRGKFAGSMRGRTMYVIPFSMGPIDSPQARFGIEITDSAYVVASMHIMTRVSTRVLEKIGDGAEWVPALHSVGMPLQDAAGLAIEDVAWPSNPDVYVVQFPETREIWSYGSGYGGNSLLGKKAMSLRIGSVQARDEGWLAEHMLLIRITAPTGKKYHLSAAFPSACGKTNLAMLRPNLPGWQVETLGDDIVWIAPGENGKLRAINPEAGLFGVAPGTGPSTNQAALDSITSDTVFTNVALTPEGDVWWEGLTKTPPEGLIDWRGQPWSPEMGTPAAHPNSRFCVPIANCTTVASDWDSPEGVELDVILFGGRRASNVPLVLEASSWQHGVFIGATISSEQTAAAEGPIGELRRDPFAMLPFCGYNMADYWGHWLSFATRTDPAKLPKIFQVNWFRKGPDGSFLWPGFADNLRVIDWVIKRLEDEVAGVDTPIGRIPAEGELNTAGLDVTEQQLHEMFAVDVDTWKLEAKMIAEFFDEFGERTPVELRQQLSQLEAKLSA